MERKELVKRLEQRLNVAKLYDESIFITIPELQQIIKILKGVNNEIV